MAQSTEETAENEEVQPKPRSRTKSDFRKSMFDEPCIIKGYLSKKSGGVVKRWQKRYFEVAGHYLKYADDQDSIKNTDIKSAMDLSHLMSVSVIDREITFQIFSDEILLQAPDVEEAQAWAKVLAAFVPDEGMVKTASVLSLAAYVGGSNKKKLSKKSLSSPDPKLKKLDSED